MTGTLQSEREAERVRQWKEAALAAMRGEFTFMSVQQAVSFAHGPDDRIYRFVDRLMQSERKAGRIRTTNGNKRKWERCDHIGDER